MSERTQTEEVAGYWQQIIDVMRQLGLLSERSQQGDERVPVADAILLPDRCIFVLDMQQLAGISRDVWLDPALWAQWEGALQGRRVSVSAGDGLALTVAREPTQPLPDVIPLSLPEPYQGCLVGYTKRLPSGEQRAILIGGAVSSAAPDPIQSAVLQLAAQRAPDVVNFAVVDAQPVDLQDSEQQLSLFTLSTAPTEAELVAARLRQRTLLAQANLTDWQYSPIEGAVFPLLLLTVDEAAA